MSTDRELLELAAKAAGIELGTWFFYNTHPEIQWQFMLADRSDIWNPLRIDGDALRLAVSIPSIDLHWIVAKAWQACESEEDRRAYVRRSIVCAVAEIGRSMP